MTQEGQSAAREDEGAVKQSNLAGTPDSAKAQGQSAASAKPASLEELWESLRPHMAERKWTNETYQEIARFEEALRLVEASPAAERTALPEIRKRIERESYWCEDCQHEIPKGADYLDDLHADHEVVRITIIEGWLATEIDAQERAGAKAASEQEGA